MKNLFDIRNESLSNEPTDAEIYFITSYVEKIFSEIEDTDLTKKTNEERQELFEKISSIKNAMVDLLSPDGGNYHKLLKELNTKVDFENRLLNIIDKLSRYISSEDRFQDGKNYSSINAVHNPIYGYKTFELSEYLNELMSVPPLTNKEADSHLKDNAEQLKPLKYLSDYLNHLLIKYSKEKTNEVVQQKSFSIVFFLRDTLLLYLGAKHLQSKGFSIDARAILINRKLINSFVSSAEINSIYKKSYNLVFQLLSVYDGDFSKEFIDKYKKMFTNNITQPEAQLLKFIREYLNKVLGNKNSFVGVDTAAHGTMPLLTNVASGRLASLEMFTSTPWLYEFYSNNIFASNFPNMRNIESLVCQEELFQFAFISEGKIYIKETCDSTTLSKAKIEIGLFLNLIDKNIPKL
jgi:hypothetical protein